MSVGVSLLSLLAALFGGAAVSLVTYLGNRGKTRAEIAKLRAETDRVRAETATLGRAGTLVRDQVATLSDRISGWELSGSHPDDYEVRLHRTIAYTGKTSALLETRPEARSFGTLMQSVDAATMRGKRIRMSAFARTEDVTHAALWMRVDGAEDTMLSFDNMDDRPITGTSGWLRHEVVLGVPAESEAIAFGVLLFGGARSGWTTSPSRPSVTRWPPPASRCLFPCCPSRPTWISKIRPRVPGRR